MVFTLEGKIAIINTNNFEGDETMKNTLPVMILKNLLLLPNQEVKLELNNEISKKIVFLASKDFKNEVIVLSPKDQIEEMPEINDLPDISIVAKIKNKIELPNGNLRVTIRGLFRIVAHSYQNDLENGEILTCSYKKMEIPEYSLIEAEAIKRKLISMVTKYVKNGQGVSNSILNVIKEVSDLNKLTDLIGAFLNLSFEKKLEYVEEINPIVRGTKLLEDLHLELEIIKLDQKLDQKLQSGLEQSQREFILKEKLREIEEELGGSNQKNIEVEKYRRKLCSISIPPDVFEKLDNEIDKFAYTSEASPELATIRNYLDWVLDLPWGVISKEETNLNLVRKSLDKSHFGLEKAKEKIVEYLGAKLRNPDIDSPILCLVGPAGVGKTTFAKSVAESLHREFYKISVGGLNDSAILNGHKRTYIGANPGKIIEALKRTKTSNPVILIDEVDKMVKDYKGDPASVLLDILDKAQNQTFVDNYIEEPFDLSKILFILTANYERAIPYELYDRLEVVELSSYTLLEKVSIAKKYLLPNLYKEHLLTAKEIKFSDSVLKYIIESYTSEAGLRELNRVLTTILRKCIVLKKMKSVKITEEMVKELLGPVLYEKNELVLNAVPGLVNGLAVRNGEGIVTPVEAILHEGHGELKVTGMVEKVMDESIQVAVGYLLKNRTRFKIKKECLTEKGIHLHFWEASTRKDGPSAGIAIVTSLLSAATNRTIPSTIALTGEITLNGFVKRIGGLKEKLIGAYNIGIQTVFIPRENHNDLVLLPKEVLESLEIIEVETYESVYEKLFQALTNGKK